MTFNRKTNEQIARRILEILFRASTKMSVKDVMAQIEPLPEVSNQVMFESAMCSCIPLISAGWVVNSGYYLAISEDGRMAFDEYADAGDLMKAAAQRSTKGWLAFRFPKSYYAAAKAKDQVVAEIRAARRISFRQLTSTLKGSTRSWKKALPIQLPRRIALSECKSGVSLIDFLKQSGIPLSEGGHAIFVPPSSFKSVFRSFAADYPTTVGLKILKEPGLANQTNYVVQAAKGDSKLHLNSIHKHEHLTLVANLLYSKGLGPRLFDLVEMEWGDQVWTAYVIEAITGGTPSMAQCEEGIGRLRQLDESGILTVSPPEGFDDAEFGCPDCDRNALVTEEGKFQYIDFQNFLLTGYGSYLKKTAMQATDASHFGDSSVFRGGNYLYQTVPGVNLPGKRSIDDRRRVLQRLLDEADASVKERLVLDIGCNIGMMMGQYLQMGAKWVHGWDRGHVTPHTEKLLLSLGCTRFSTTGTDITESSDLLGDIPKFLYPSLDGCAISYLAVRGHIGWLKALESIPWLFLIYEGHEDESRKDFEEYLTEFKSSIGCTVAAVEEYVDGDSDTRTLAILRRTS